MCESLEELFKNDKEVLRNLKSINDEFNKETYITLHTIWNGGYAFLSPDGKYIRSLSSLREHEQLEMVRVFAVDNHDEIIDVGEKVTIEWLTEDDIESIEPYLNGYKDASELFYAITNEYTVEKILDYAEPLNERISDLECIIEDLECENERLRNLYNPLYWIKRLFRK